MNAAQPEPPELPQAGLRQERTWLLGRSEVQGFPRYLEAIRAGRWIIAAALIACVGAAAAYLGTASKVYNAEADVLVSPHPFAVPIPGEIVPSSDPMRDVQTGARLIASPPVARLVKNHLHLTGT